MTASASRAFGLFVLTLVTVRPVPALCSPSCARSCACSCSRSCSAPAQGPAPAHAVTDSDTPLHLLKADCRIPYGPTTPEKITEVLQRIRGYLEVQTPARIVDRTTGQPLADLAKPGTEPVAEPGAFRVTSYGVGAPRLLRHAARRGDDGRPGLQGLRGPAPRPRRDARRPLPRAPRPERPSPRSVLEPRALDDAGSLCAAMIKASRAGVAANLRPTIDNFVAFISTKEFRLPDGTLARNRPQPNTLWLDDLYMGVPALAQMGKLTGERRYTDDAVKQVLQFSGRMFNREQGLFMHGWVQGMEVHPEFRWARANGWAVMTLVQLLLDVLPEDHPDRGPVIDLLRAHVRGLAARQSGRASAPATEDSYLETSATAIYAYAIAHAIDRGWIDPVAYGPAALLAWNAVTTKVNAQGQVEGTCVGTGMGFDPAFDDYRPTSPFAAHGYGPVLLAGAEMIRLVKTHRFEINDSSTQLYR